MAKPTIFIIFLVVALPCLAMASFEQDAFRFLQFSQGEAASTGPQQSSMSLTITTRAGVVGNDRLGRYVVLLHAEEVSVAELEHLSRACGGMVILYNEEGKGSEEWMAAQQWLLTHAVPVPVYFVHSNERWEGIARDLDKLARSKMQAIDQFWPLQNSYHLEIAAPAPKLVDELHLPSVQSFLAGSGSNPSTIIITAHVDTFSSAPATSFGVNDNGSGVMALLELARLFSKLYEEESTRGENNILFLVTSGGRLNHAGVKHWLSKLDVVETDRIEYALNLDAIGESDLYLHVTRSAKNDRVEQLYNIISETASTMNIPYDVVQKKINLKDDNVYWGHEQFARKKVVSGTISSLPVGKSFLDRANVYDNKKQFSETTFRRNVELLRVSLLRHVYNLKGSEQLPVLSSDYSVSPNMLHAWVEYFSSHARMDGFDNHEASFMDPVRVALEEICGDAELQDAVIKTKGVYRWR